MINLLAPVMALRKAILSSIHIYPNCNVAEGCQSENLFGFCRSAQGDEEWVEVFGWRFLRM
jgi:hypothetical protein